MSGSIGVGTEVDPEEWTLRAALDVARNAMWNYVTLIVWLRWMRRLKVGLGVAPIALSALGSWQILTAAKRPEVAMFAAVLALLAGLIPLLHLASGLDGRIAETAQLAGSYRALEARVRDLVLRYGALPVDERRSKYQSISEKHIELKGVAYTAPPWAFRVAERLIARGDYNPLSERPSPNDGAGAGITPAA